VRLVQVSAPEGRGADVARVAHGAGIGRAGVRRQVEHRAHGPAARRDIVEVETSTPAARAFVDALLAAPFYDPRQYALSVREARAVASAHEGPARVTRPFRAPALDVYQELWQFSHVTPSFVGRVLVAGALLAYGMIQDQLLVMAAGLLFLPVLPALLAAGLGARTGEWRLAGRAALALAVAAGLTVLAGAGVALLAAPPLRFQDFPAPLPGFLLSLGIGVAAGLATTDDAGRRELVGLGAASQVALVPAWLGASLVYGLGDGGPALLAERLGAFGVNTATIVAAAAATYAALGLSGDSVRRAAAGAAGAGGPSEDVGRRGEAHDQPAPREQEEAESQGPGTGDAHPDR
jgi:hypothetical protein